MTEKPAKARIYRLKATPKGSAETSPKVDVDGDAITVQFNPTSLKIERNNPTSGGVTAKAQPRHHANEGHATLSLELEYDTAEGDENGRPLDVRNLTAKLRQFTEPPQDDPKKAPPRLRFIWGQFIFDGIVERISEDIDYFDADGLALRAKVSLTIKEQNERFAENAVGPGSREAQNAPKPLAAPAGNGPGGQPTRTPDRALDARNGESVQQALARAGLDPATWRSAMSGLTSPLALAAGTQLQLDASASVGAGVGVAAGFSAGVGAGAAAGVSARLSVAASAAASAGVTASAGAGFGSGLVVGDAGLGGIVGGAAGGTVGGTVGADAQASAGFALSAAGGVEAAARGALVAEAAAGDAVARASFAVPGSATTSGFPGSSASASAGVSASASASSATEVSATSAARAEVDPRTSTFGRSVPLKPPPRLW